MAKGLKTGDPIDSPMGPSFRRGVPSLTEAPGSYDKHPNVGPAGVSGGLPLKFTDDSVPGTVPNTPSMEPMPAAWMPAKDSKRG